MDIGVGGTVHGVTESWNQLSMCWLAGVYGCDRPQRKLSTKELMRLNWAGGFFTTSKGKPREILGNPGLYSAVCQLYLNTTGRKNLSK